MSDLKESRLVLFFTQGVSLKTWSTIGMLDREVSLYRSLRPHMHNITFVTYGDAEDLHYADILDDINIVCNRYGLSQRWYASLLPLFYRLFLHGPSIIKSNQLPGAEVALKVAKLFGMKFIAQVWLSSLQLHGEATWSWIIPGQTSTNIRKKSFY